MSSANSSVPAVYTWVIGDVVEKMNRKFAELGLDENVLTDLKTIWETKVRQMGVASFPPLEGSAGGPPSTAAAAAAGNSNVYQTQRDLNYTDQAGGGLYLPHGSAAGYHVPQNDGATDEFEDQQELHNTNSSSPMTKKLSRHEIDALIIKNGLIPSAPSSKSSKRNKEGSLIPQLDGGDDEDDDEDDDDDGSELASDLDDDEDDENAPTDHLILCQYEKVSRIKNKWKCILKDGVVNINGRDYMFSRATGDFEW